MELQILGLLLGRCASNEYLWVQAHSFAEPLSVAASADETVTITQVQMKSMRAWRRLVQHTNPVWMNPDLLRTPT